MKKLKPYVLEFKKKNYDHFDEFYEMTKKQLFFIIIQIIKDEDLTNDLMQETYLKFLKSIDQVKVNQNISAYLSMIARNLAIDLYRKRKKEIVADDLIANLPDDQVPYENNEDIFKILDHLEEDEREIVILHVLNDLKFREIADIIEKPLGTVLWIYQKAIKKLKGKIGDYL